MTHTTTHTQVRSIMKLKNLLGVFYTCSNCGREIKHAYVVNSSNVVYGSECVKDIAGWTRGSKMIREQDARMKTVNWMMSRPEQSGWNGLKEDTKRTDDELMNCYLSLGRF